MKHLQVICEGCQSDNADKPGYRCSSFFGMVSKTAKGNHFPVRIQIFVHDKSPLKCDKSNVNIKKGGGRIKK